jgi:bis(5'-nucleosyl)-tetraphosphatase (symmetrical)
MATYAIGDIQGCYAPLKRLLRRIKFDPKNDRLWLTGDLVNRGPDSLDVMRWAMDQGDRLSVVLGNHDIHLIARYYGVTTGKKRDTLDDVLDAKDVSQMIEWLCERPFLVREGPYIMVHAGLMPEWSADKAEGLAADAAAALRTGKRRELLRDVYDDSPKRWDDDFGNKKRMQLLFAAFTRMRILTKDGALQLDFSGAPSDIPSSCLPWFDHPARRTRDSTVIFGHWAGLGLHVTPSAVGLDSGCVWGGSLTAYRLEDREIFQEPCG